MWVSLGLLVFVKRSNCVTSGLLGKKGIQRWIAEEIKQWEPPCSCLNLHRNIASEMFLLIPFKKYKNTLCTSHNALYCTTLYSPVIQCSGIQLRRDASSSGRDATAEPTHPDQSEPRGADRTEGGDPDGGRRLATRGNVRERRPEAWKDAGLKTDTGWTEESRKRRAGMIIYSLVNSAACS